MKKLRPREQILLAILAFAGGFFLLRFLGGSEADAGVSEPRAPVSRSGRQSADRRNTAPGPTAAARLDLAALEASRAEFEPGRNLWRFENPPAPPRPKPPPPKPPVQVPKVEPKPKPEPTGPVEPPKPIPPDVDVTYLGRFGPKSRPIAVFTDGEEVLYNAGEGEVVKDLFVVHAIGFESVDLGFVGFSPDEFERLEIGRR